MDSTAWLSGVEVAARIRSGELRPVDVVDEAIARIEAANPELACVVIPLFERARDRVDTVDLDAPFAGVPMLLKDAGEELAGTPLWVGTQGLRRCGHTSQATTVLAGRFEELGAVIVGKSACPELSASSTTEPPGFEPTRNPWDLTRSVGGSSGGSAAAVAAGLVPIAHGSDGSGSLRFPASLCGVVTLKPSRGRVASSAAAGSPDPLDLWTQFVVARDVRDLIALFCHVGSGVAGRAWSTDRRLRVGFVESDPIIGLDVAPSCAAAVERVSAALADLGHHVEPSFPAAFATLFEPFWTAMATIGPWVRAGQVEWLAQQLGRPCQAGDVSDEVLALADRGRALPKRDVDAALERAASVMAPVADWWDDGHDVLLSPVMLQPAWTLGDDAPMHTGMFAAPFSFTGQPAVVVPGGWTDEGLPVGVQLVGRPGADELLLGLAADLQPRLGWLDRRPPAVG